MASTLVNNKYRITRRIGGGSFGEIYMGIGPSGEKVAIKFERQGTRCPQLRHEYKVYRELANCPGFCNVYHFGTQDNYNVMVMDLLGPSLEDLFNRCNRRFSLKTVLQIADQMLERIDTLHSRHLIHRDIKPANFVVGVVDNISTVFCVDFGLSKRYRHPKTLQHIPHRDGRSLTGTPRYASINNHLGVEQSRRDDLESVGYVLIYFLKGTLPWQGLKAKNAQKKYRLIMEKKQQVSIAQLCQGCPSQFAEFLAYTRSLKFDAKPDIPYVRKLFRDLYHAQGFASVGKLWDWDNLDLDFAASEPGTVGSGGPGGPMAVPMGMGGPSGANLRPTTAAAVANAMESDLLLGTDGLGDESGFENSGRKMDRPNTAGPMVGNNAGGANKMGSAQGGNGSSWLFSNPQGGQAGGVPQQGYAVPNSAGAAGTDANGQPRRPHTAHVGNRAPAPSGPGQVMPQVADARRQTNVSNPDDEDGEDHVVAGARAMMRYRKSRTEGGQGSSGNLQAQGQPTSSAGGASNPAAINKSASGNMQQQGGQSQQQAQLAANGQRKPSAGNGALPGATAGNSAGWIATNSQAQESRPKSAGIMTSLTGGSKMFSSGGNAAPTTTSSAAGTSTAAQGTSGGTSHLASLSYGSLKNRFLSGGGNNATSATNTAAAKPASAGGNGVGGLGQYPGGSNPVASKTSSSKMFGLSR